jgi:hypothetical protein
MTELLVIKERLKKAYSVYGAYIDAAARGLLVLSACVAVNTLIGYMPLLQSPFIILLLAVIAAFLPVSASMLIVSVVILGNLFSVTMEAALLFAVLMLLFVLTFFVLKPGNSHIMTLSIALGALRFFGPLPMILGLMYSPLALFPMTFGLVVSQYMTYISDNYVLLSSKTSTLTNIQKISQIAAGVCTNEQMWTMVVILILVSLIVYAIRRLQVRNSWFYAIVIGVFMHLLLTLLCDFMFDIRESYFILAINLILEVLVGVSLWFFFFMVDYSREETVQFEDDEYYYYVKAVPKVTVTVPEVRVTRIRERSVKDTARTSGQVTFVMDDRDGDTVDVEEREDD